MARKKKLRGQLVILSGPSGVGKSTVISELMGQRSDLYFSVSFTTRNPRVGEADGVNYNFVSRETFEGMIARNELLEHAEYVGNYYGTSLKVLEEKMSQGIDVLLDIEVQGASLVRSKCPDAILIFIIPPSFEELSRRLVRRNTDSGDTIQHRLNVARQEYREIPNYDYLVVNDKVSNAAAEIEAIMAAEDCKAKNRLHIIEGVNGSYDALSSDE